MKDILKRDRTVLIKEVVAGRRVIALMAVAGIGWLLGQPTGFDPWFLLMAGTAILGATLYSAYVSSVPKRFHSPKFLYLWGAVSERHLRFKKALRQLSKRGIADLADLPRTIEGIVQDLYVALRRADMIENEVASSEGWLMHKPPVPGLVSHDQQAQELYRIADKNIAEYRQRFQSVMAGVERTEAQAAVLTTTLDTLRMKMLGYRLVGRETESPTQEFLVAITEARMQLDSIDKALTEIELTPFPTTITVLPDHPVEHPNLTGPPPMPEAARPMLQDDEDHVPRQNQ